MDGSVNVHVIVVVKRMSTTIRVLLLDKALEVVDYLVRTKVVTEVSINQHRCSEKRLFIYLSNDEFSNCVVGSVRHMNSISKHLVVKAVTKNILVVYVGDPFLDNAGRSLYEGGEDSGVSHHVNDFIIWTFDNMIDIITALGYVTRARSKEINVTGEGFG